MKAILTVGIPGCGKSTYARGLCDHVEVNRDQIRAELTGSAADHSREAAVNRRHRQRIRQAATHGRDLIVSDTNTVRRQRRELIGLLKELGYQVEVLVFDVGPATCLARNPDRDKPVARGVIEKMARRLRACPPSLEEGMDRIRHLRPESCDRLWSEAAPQGETMALHARALAAKAGSSLSRYP